MFSILNNMICTLFFIINIKLCLSEVRDHCENGKYSTLTMDCASDKLTRSLRCQYYREDGLKCWNAELKSDESEKDFYGKYFTQPQKLAGGDGKYDFIITDITKYDGREVNCGGNDEYLILVSN